MVERFTLGNPDEVAARIRALAPPTASVIEDVKAIVEDVRVHGDAALLRYVEQFDGVEGVPAVTGRELDAALQTLDPEVRAGLEVAMTNVRAVAETMLGQDHEVALPQGAARAPAPDPRPPRGGLRAGRAGRRTRRRSSWAR